MPNRLADSTSPYLLQHRNNPVDWYPWGAEAFARAEQEDKPIFLSIGYSSCHWCHVMEHECFEDAEVAQALNAGFVCIKVDREERPDVDEAYMTAVQLSSGRGGWPMSVFMTPSRKPFFAGTYFPKLDRGQSPGMMTLCRQISMSWKTRREELEHAAEQFAQAMREALSTPAPGTFSRLDEEFLGSAVTALATDFDRENGGFGGAPKFPPHSALEFLTAYAQRESAPDELREAAVAMVLRTVEKMVLGGIHDHVGGGFHRYSTDEKWILPHFEKMLYDNAMMVANLARVAGIAHHVAPEVERALLAAVSSAIAWLGRELRSGDGLFYSALDADSEGEEGKFYVWSEDEVKRLLDGRAEAFMSAFNFEREGNYRDESAGKRTGGNIPFLIDFQGAAFDDELDTLLEVRERRIRPSLDDKALVGWNGLAIRSLALAGVMPYAEKAAEAILAAERSHGRLPRQIVRGEPAGEGYLEDYAYFVQALIELAQSSEVIAGHLEAGGRVEFALARDAGSWLAEARRLGAEMVDRFYDEEAGGFFAVSPDHEELFGRNKPVFDQPIPSANAIAIRCLIDLGDHERAQKSIDSMLGWMERAPTSTQALFLTALTLTPAESEQPERPREPTAVEVTVSTKRIYADKNGLGSGEVRIRVPRGLHLNSSEPPARWLVPTRLEIRPLESEIHYPPSADGRYEGEISIRFEVRLPERVSETDFDLAVSYQPCSESECQIEQVKSFSFVLARG